MKLVSSLRLAVHPLLALAAFASAASASAQDWTRFRGPNGSGLGEAKNLPVQWAESDFNWRIDLPGHGHSSPVVWGGKVFITASEKETARRFLLCVNTADGVVSWKKEWEAAAFRQHADNSFASSSPAVDQDRVYVFWASPEQSSLIALDHAGNEVWQHELGPFVSQHGSGASPVVFKDSVVLYFDQDVPESFLLALDSATGKERWKRKREGNSSSSGTPCLRQAADGRAEFIVTSRSVGMTAIDAGTGEKTWELPKAFSRRCVSSPILAGDLVVATCGEGTSEAWMVAVKPGAPGGTEPALAWELPRVPPYVPTPIAVGDLLFLWKDYGLVTCLRAATKEQLWSEKVEGAFYGSPVCVNGRLYNMTRRGEMVVLAAGEKFEPLARNPVGEGSHATPAISGGRMFLRTFSHLLSIGK